MRTSQSVYGLTALRGRRFERQAQAQLDGLVHLGDITGAQSLVAYMLQAIELPWVAGTILAAFWVSTSLVIPARPTRAGAWINSSARDPALTICPTLNLFVVCIYRVPCAHSAQWCV